MARTPKRHEQPRCAPARRKFVFLCPHCDEGRGNLVSNKLTAPPPRASHRSPHLQDSRGSRGFRATAVRGLKPTAPQRKPAAGSCDSPTDRRLSIEPRREPAAGFRWGAVGFSPRTAVARECLISIRIPKMRGTVSREHRADPDVVVGWTQRPCVEARACTPHRRCVVPPALRWGEDQRQPPASELSSGHTRNSRRRRDTASCRSWMFRRPARFPPSEAAAFALRYSCRCAGTRVHSRRSAQAFFLRERRDRTERHREIRVGRSSVARREQVPTGVPRCFPYPHSQDGAGGAGAAVGVSHRPHVDADGGCSEAMDTVATWIRSTRRRPWCRGCPTD